MPPFVQTLAKLLIAFPGFLIWLYACLMAIGASGALVVRGASRNELVACLVTFLVSFLVAQIGHAMRVMTGILTGAPALRFAGEHMAARFAWDALVQLAGILFAASALITLGTLADGNLPRLAWVAALFILLIWAFRYLWRKRFDLHTRWWRELAAREAERATMEFHARRAAQGHSSSGS